jgi:hypothetical protein
MSIQRINTGRGNGHYYRIDGQKADGVTTLISGGLPKPALLPWGIKSVAEYAADHLDLLVEMQPMGREAIVAALKQSPYSDRDKAANRGTEVHKLADDLMHGREVEVPPELAGYVDSCVRFLDDTRIEPVATELTVASRKWNYCGTLDLVGRLPDGRVVIGDYKTSRSGIYGETGLQLAAYAHAEVWLDGTDTKPAEFSDDLLTKFANERPVADLGITSGVAVWVRADGYDVYPVDVSDRAFNAFLHVAWVARMARDQLKGFIGEAVDPRAWVTPDDVEEWAS